MYYSLQQETWRPRQDLLRQMYFCNEVFARKIVVTEISKFVIEK